ncbi:MAG: amidohydrolase family protein [Gemmatimonadetes bacterium]|nr:amidohydrolase family protein [Gemmatimonadota bacterium]
MRPLGPVVLFALLGFGPNAPFLAAQAPADSAWDVTKPRGATREIDFTTSEGTWTAVDVSPDGNWLVFDLLGHIYRMPIAGGQAVPLTQPSGIAMNIQPRISPDGKRIVFVSDRKGQMNLWVMDADGGNPTPVHLDQKTEYRWPSWRADGEFIVALKLGGATAVTMMHRRGGTGVELLRAQPGSAPSRPTVSADGRTVYYDLITARGQAWGREDALMGKLQVQGLDLVTGVVRRITAGEATQANADHTSSGGAYGAEPSPDGRYLSFLRKLPGGTLNYRGQRFGPRSALWIRDLATGAERLAMDPVEMDMSEESFPTAGSYPPYDWTPDSKAIVIHQGGRIRRLDVATGAVTTIPFTARVHRVISEQAWVKNTVPDGPVDVRFLRWATASPDGRTLAFQAVGRIWVMPLPGGQARRLTSAGFDPFEFQPAWSPDGRSIAFTSWHHTDRGALWIVPAEGGEPRRVTRDAGEFLNPAWTADGRELVLLRGAGATARGQSMVWNPFFDVVKIPAAGGAETFLAQVDHDPAGVSRQPEVPRPSVTDDGRVFFAVPKSVGGGGVELPEFRLEIVSVRLDGSDRRVAAEVQKAGSAIVSPTGRFVAFTQGNNVYVTPLPAGAGTTVPLINRRGGVLPVTQLSTEGGLLPRWRNAEIVDFASANRVFSHHTGTGRTDTVTVSLSQPRDQPTGTIALTGARIIPLDRRPVINGGTVVVRGGRISCVGRCSTAGVDRIVNVAGKTIIPGWFDLHAHSHHEHVGMLPSRNFETAVWLGYGVTTIFDPSIFSPDPFVSAELVDAGQMIGPRIYSAGEAITGGDDVATNEINSYDEALREVARRKAWGSPMTKQYNQPSRTQRQWVVEAVRRLGMRTTAEGSNDLYHKVGMVMDGHTGGEHMTVQAPLYGDFLTFMAKARYFYSHTPLVSGYGAWNEEYFWQESPVWLNPKLQKWIPWRQLIPHTRRFVMRPETDYSKDIVAQSVADLIALGGYTALGSHGQQDGLGPHWEVWMLAKAAGPLAALEVASMHGATFLGLDGDLGSIAVGKLADLMILNGNPLENVRNTANIQYVMKGGVLYDANSLDQVWPGAVNFGDTYWVVPEMYRIDEKRVDGYDRRPQ